MAHWPRTSLADGEPADWVGAGVGDSPEAQWQGPRTAAQHVETRPLGQQLEWPQCVGDIADRSPLLSWAGLPQPQVSGKAVWTKSSAAVSQTGAFAAKWRENGITRT